MIFIWWKLKMSYQTAYPNWDSPAVVCHLFLYLFICGPTTTFTWLSKFCTSQLSSIFLNFLRNPYRAGYRFWRGPTIFNYLRRQFVKVHAPLHIKVHWKTFHPICFLNLPPAQNSREALHTARGMYCTIHLLEIIRLSDFSSPLFYPSLLVFYCMKRVSRKK